MITVFMIVAFAMLVPLARFFARRADAAQLKVRPTAAR
jgi:H+/gluconate symporter-like permease